MRTIYNTPRTIYNIPTSELIYSYVFPDHKTIRSRHDAKDIVYKRLSKKYKLDTSNIKDFLEREEEVIKSRGDVISDYYFHYQSLDKTLNDFLSKLGKYPGNLEGLSTFTYSELAYFYSIIKRIATRYDINMAEINDYLLEFKSAIKTIDKGISAGYDLYDVRKGVNKGFNCINNEIGVYSKYSDFWKELKKDLILYISYLTDYHLYEDCLMQTEDTLRKEEKFLNTNGLNKINTEIYRYPGDEFGLLHHDKTLLNKFDFAYFNDKK